MASTIDLPTRKREPRGLDYADRKRNFEWRRDWFYSHRPDNDREFLATLVNGIKKKREMIKRQRPHARHLGAYAPAGAGTPWFTIGPRNVNGRVKCLAVHPTDPDTLYAGAASGGVWKSTDGGQSWRPLWDEQDTMAIGAVAIAPSAPDTVYAGTGEWTPGYVSFPGTGLFVSTNGGATWTQRSGLTSRRVSQVLVSPTDANTIYVAGEDGFEQSVDGGVTWTTLHTGEISDAVMDPNDANKLYINVRNDGVYKSTDAGSNWSKLTSAPSGASADWIRLAIGKSGASGSDLILAKQAGTLYRSTDGGTSWTTLSGSHGYASYDTWCNLLSVAPDDDDVILAGGVSAEITTDGGSLWNSLSGLHSDHHRAVFAPSDPSIVYTSNDGGVYRSDDKGATWTKVSDGLIITQFYDVGSWSHIGTVVGGGAQDTGTNMTTGGLTWGNIFGWDGGYFVVHPTDPRTMYAEHQNTDVYKSTDGGTTWVSKSSGLSGSTPWTGVLTMDPNAPDTLFVGTDRVFRTTDGCATSWATSSQTLSGQVSSIAVAESDSNRVYAGTDGGKVYRSDDNGVTSPWADKSSGLMARSVTDVVVDTGDADRVLVAFGGTASGSEAHSVFLSTDGGDSWTDISGDLPNVSVNALAFDPTHADTIYAGTDVGVFRTEDAGATWQAFDNGIPNVIVTDLVVDPGGELLIAATMGRGMYKISISGATEPTVDLYLRDSVLDTGERFPSPSNEPNPNDLTDQVYWWESPDIKVDNLPYYVQDALFDGVEFDELDHEDPKRDEVNRFYVQLHNRGWQNTTNVHVRAFLADASAGLPPLPNALVPPDFNLTSTADWTPIGASQTVALLEPNRPVIVSWDYTVPSTTATHSCLLAVLSSDDDPITTSETDVDVLISNEKRVCLKNLHIIDGGSAPQQTMETIKFANVRDHADLMDIVIVPEGFRGGAVGLLLPKVHFADEATALDGVRVYPLQPNENIGKFYLKWGSRAKVDAKDYLKAVDLSRVYEFDPAKTSALRGIKLARGAVLKGILTIRGSKHVRYGELQRFAAIQMQGGKVVGGSTYELRMRRARGLLPISHIRVVLEKVRILDDHDPWIKGAGEFRFTTVVGFNDRPDRRTTRRVPSRGILRISDKPGRNEREIDACIFDGYVTENDRMEVAIVPVEEDWLDPDDSLCRYRRRFDGPPETWVGRHTPDDEPASADPERVGDWRLWYRVESLPL